MTTSVEILNAIPNPSDFYDNYWNKKSFVVKGGIDQNILDKLIPADELAGLSMEEDVRSRIVKRGSTPNDWTCDHGPFAEEIFSTLGENNWSLLVQEVEEFHPGTAELLSAFSFSPRWLIDDIMVSYSTVGGGVGPHLDSYHVFLIQGTGKRRWKLGREAIRVEKYIDGLDLKILKDDFVGDSFEVEEGDVIYIPPYFPHAGDTLSEALTYSIGFLGPSLSELLVEFGHYVEEQEALNKRYDGNMLSETSAGEDMANQEVENFRGSLIDVIKTDQFEVWLKEYFSGERI